MDITCTSALLQYVSFCVYIHLYSPKTVEICELYSYTKINDMLK